jgi:hypothetical protein
MKNNKLFKHTNSGGFTAEIDSPNYNMRNKYSRMVSSGILGRVALVRTDVSEEPAASFIKVTRIGEIGKRQAATSNQRLQRMSVASCSLCCS